MLGFMRWSMTAMVLVTACGFDSGGVPGSGASAATIGSNDTTGTTTDAPDPTDGTTASTSASTTKDPSTTATTDSDPDSGMTADPSTTASTTSPVDDTGDSSGPMIAETGDDASQGSLESSPMDTGALESSSGMTDDGGVVPPDAPYYGDCDENAECGEAGLCYSTLVNNGPDAHVCLVPCGEGCPPPETGEAMELCTTSGYCVLACQQDEDCPDGMACYVFEIGQKDEYRRCLWSQG